VQLEEDYARRYRKRNRTMSCVEVWWRGEVHRHWFPPPRAALALSQERKDAFLQLTSLV